MLRTGTKTPSWTAASKILRVSPARIVVTTAGRHELNKVNPAYNAIVELTTQLQNKFDFITSSRDRYKTWVDELNKAELLARDICYQLKLIAIQSDKIWYNTCEAEKAVEILFCMLRDIYMQIDEMKTMFDTLQNCITRNNDPALGKGQGILKYLDDYKSKLDATVKTRDDVIRNIVHRYPACNPDPERDFDTSLSGKWRHAL